MFIFGDPIHAEPYVKLRKRLSLPILHYTTLDGLPIYQKWKELFTGIDVNVAITEWAMNEYMKAGFPMNGYVHHGINWQYWQISELQRQTIKRKYGLEGQTVFISWDVNQYRKRIDALLRCWRDFNPLAKKAKLVLFTDWKCRLGWDLEAKIDEYNIPRETIISPLQLTGREKIWECAEEPWMIKEIAALGDIYLSTTGGEGFGRCLLEAATAQMPVIATNYSAVPEVLDKYGVLIPTYEGRAGRYQMHDMARFTELGLVNEEKFTEAMLYYYDHPEERRELGIKANEWTRNFDYDSQIMVGWNQMLSQINPDVILANSLLRK
jgi:glycosyltransferase involved in cell wall biosynthesis